MQITNSLGSQKLRADRLLGGLALLTLLVIALLAFRSWRRFETTAASSDRSRTMLAANRDLMKTLKGTEAAMRLYLLTGRPSELTKYEALARSLETSQARLREVAQPAHLDLIAEIDRLITKRMSSLAAWVEVRRSQGLEAASQFVQTSGGMETIDQLEAASAEILRQENIRQADSEQATENLAFQTFLQVVLGCGLEALILWLLGRAVKRGISERNRALHDLAGARQRLEITLASIGDGVIATDQAGNITLLNPVAEKLTGWASGEALGRPAAEVLRITDESTGMALVNPLQSVLQSGAAAASPRYTVLLPRSGAPVAIADSISPIREGDGETVGAVLVFRDVRETREAQAQIEKWHRLFRAGGFGMAVIDSEDDTLRELNPAFAAMHGYSEAELLGTKLGSLLENPDESRGRWRDDRATFESMHLHRDGTVFPVLTDMTIFQDAAGRATERAAYFSDITARVQRATELRVSNEALRRSNTDLEQFAYAASHDLQEPLRMVALYTQLLGEEYGGQLDVTARGYLNHALRGALRMEALLQALLAYSTVTAPLPGDSDGEPADALRDALANLESLIARTGAAVRYGHLPRVRLPAVRLMQLFQNLVGNSIKYRQPDVPPVIEISAIRDEEGRWEFSVRDNGIGIAAPYWEQVFGIFKRLHGADYEGTGIGLAICQRIIDNSGGRIWVTSQLGQGTTVHFTLPGV